ncbi:pectinesterase precursor [Seiridium cupressi]
MARCKKKGAGACKKTTGTKQPAAIDDTTRDQTKAADRQPQTIPATTFRPFSKLPIEFRLITWECALSKESAKRIVLQDTYGGGLMPSKQLVSPLLLVNKESREAAQKFYNLRLDVHAKTNYGDAKGVLYLNFKYDTLVLNVDSLFSLQDEFLKIPPLIAGAEKDYVDYMIHKWSLKKTYPFNVPHTYVTTRLTEAQRAHVERIYDIEETPPLDDPSTEPPCCWACSYRLYTHEDFIDRLSIRAQCPNVWLCQLLFLSVFYEEPDLLNGFASLSPEKVHEGISPYLATCDYPPVRYTGGGEFEPDTDCEDGPGSSSESDDSIADSDAEVVGLEDGVDSEEAADLNEETQ